MLLKKALKVQKLFQEILTPEKLSKEEINKIKERILTGGHVGSIVSNDFTSSLIKVELTEFNRKTGEKLDYLQLGKDIEEIRDEFEQGNYRVEIIWLC